MDDFSIEDLNKYMIELKNEIIRVEKEIEQKSNVQEEAQRFFR